MLAAWPAEGIPGDPEVLRDAAEVLEEHSRRAREEVAGNVRLTERTVLADWSGLAAEGFEGYSTAALACADALVEIGPEAARALRVYADELEAAQRRYAAHAADARDAERDAERADESRAEHRAREDAQDAHRALGSACEEALEANERCARQIRALKGSVPTPPAAPEPPASGESPWLPLLRAVTSGGFVYGLSKWFPYWRQAQLWNTLWAPGSPLAWWASERAMQMLPTFNNGFVGRMLAPAMGRVPALAGASRWLANPAKATPVFRGLGIAGGAVGFGLGAYDLYQQGDPVEAFERDPAAYASDVAGTAFSASTTAFLVAPNPITAGAAAVTGLAWAGTEIWDHHEEIGQALDAGVDMAGEVADDVIGAITPW